MSPQAKRRGLPIVVPALIVAFLILLSLADHSAASVRAQTNPTPIVIDLTPTSSSATVTPTATAGPGGVVPDPFEPNNEAMAATLIGLGILSDLTLTEGDADYFTGFAKAGQTIELNTSVDATLDTRLTLFWQGQAVAVNDDRTALDLGSTVIFSASEDGYYIALVEAAGPSTGTYALEVSIVEPQATATPAATTTPLPSATPVLPPDVAEPNDDAATAFPIVPTGRYQLTVGHGDVDVFLFLGKAGNRYSCQTVTSQVDTLVEISGSAGQLAANDDRGQGHVDSYVEFAIESDQTIFVTVAALGGSFGPYEFGCDFALPGGGGGQSASGSGSTTSGGNTGSGQPAGSSTGTAGSEGAASVAQPAGSSPTITQTAMLSSSHLVPLTVRSLGELSEAESEALTAIRLIIYYDANNDRQPSPGEGVANVSVVAVDSTGQQIARVFTNGAGEAIFNLRGDVARIIVPFVSGWSTVVRTGQLNEEVQLGLPAVIIPRFFPIEAETAE